MKKGVETKKLVEEKGTSVYGGQNPRVKGGQGTCCNCGALWVGLGFDAVESKWPNSHCRFTSLELSDFGFYKNQKTRSSVNTIEEMSM